MIACLSIGLVGLISCLLDSNVAASATSTGTGKITVRNQNAISIEVTGNQGNGSNVVKLKPALGGAVETGTATIKVSTNLPGYNLVIKDADEETALVSSKDDMYTIPAGIPEQGTSAWGYKVDDAEGWNTISTNSTLVKNRNTVPPEGGDVTLVTFGVSINSKQMEGNYLDEVLFIVVANDGPSIPPTPEEEPTLSNLAYMQDMTPEICSRSAEHETKQLVDKRDGKRYWVAKLQDGQCWMVQNLALDLSTSKKLTPRDTDITSDWTPTHNTETVVPAKGAMADYEKVARSWNLGNYVYTTPTDGTLCSQAVGTDDLYDNVMTGGTFANLSCDGRYKPYASSDDAHYSVGNYYTYSAATAKTGDSLTGDMDGSSIASGSICPKGWTLPKSGVDGNILSTENQFYQLLHAYGYPLITITAPYFIKIKIAKTKCYIYCIIHNHYRARPFYEKNHPTCDYAPFVL